MFDTETVKLKIKVVFDFFFGDKYALLYNATAIPAIIFYIDFAIYLLGKNIFGHELSIIPDMFWDFINNLEGTFIGTDLNDPITIILLIPICIVVFMVGLNFFLVPLVLIYFSGPILAKPFKPEFIENLIELFLGFFLGATLYLVVAIFSTDEIPTARLIGGIFGFIFTCTLIYLSLTG